MLNNNFAGTTAGIIRNTRPTITPNKQEDYGQLLGDALNNWQTGQQRAADQQKRDEWAATIRGMDNLDPAQKELFANNPEYYNDYMKAENQFARQKELAEMNNKNAIALKMFEAQNKKLTNPYMDNPFDKKRIESRAREIDENIAKSEALIDKYKKASILLDKNSFGTGDVRGLLAPITTKFNKDAADFQALVNEIVPTMRPAGSGSTSDRDMAIFEKATFGFDKPKEANRNIINGRIAVEENNKAKNELFADYITRGMGTPSDFDREWRMYLAANPIFGDDEGNTLNKNRIDAYSWFAGERPKNSNDGSLNTQTNQPQKSGRFTITVME